MVEGNKQTIKVFVACHQETPVPNNPILVPLQVGASLSRNRFSNFHHDDTGENISSKNRNYCELTAQYWAWKNETANYFGFFHYRRFLFPDLKEKTPYKLCKTQKKELFLNMSYPKFPETIEQYDIILPKPENMWISVEEHYARARYHNASDLELLQEIVTELYPQYHFAMEAYLSQNHCYWGNIFIMKDVIFQEYMEWLFSILEEFEARKNFTHYPPQEARVLGYLGERLLGIYVFYIQNRGGSRILHLPRVLFLDDDFQWYSKVLVNFIFPPSSRRRSCVKSLRQLWSKKINSYRLSKENIC